MEPISKPQHQIVGILKLAQLVSNVQEQVACDISDQEYLDREDSYTLMFFIQSSDTGIPRIPTMKVNDWIIRLNDSELGS